jgi:hypothetical protein
MIIGCPCCNKKFYVDWNLIFEKGRLLQCSVCDNKWFFKNEITVKKTETTKINESLELFNVKKSHINQSINLSNNDTINNKINPPSEIIVKKKEINKTKIQKKNLFLSSTIIFIISFVALIIILDTFKIPLGKIFPKLEFFLYNLYETINNIILFIRDLI